MTRLARVTLAASIDAAKSGRPLAMAMKRAAKAAAAEDADGCCRECGGEAEHLDACPVINEGRPYESHDPHGAYGVGRGML